MASFMTPPLQRIIELSTSAGFYVPMTDFMPAIGVKELQYVLEVVNSTSGFKHRFAYQKAKTHVESVESWAVLSALTQGTGDGRFSSILTSVGTVLDDAYWVRFGLQVQVVTDGNFEHGDVTMVVAGTSST